MGSVLAAVSALLLTAAGAAAALSAPLGAAWYGGQYLAGHVLLGFGLGYSTALLLRISVRRLVSGLRARKVTVRQASVPTAVLTMLPVRPPAVVPLRGRHAA